MNEIIGLAMLITAFGVGYVFGLRHADWRLKEATKRLDRAIKLVRDKQ